MDLAANPWNFEWQEMASRIVAAVFEAFLVKKDHIDAAVVEGVAGDLGLRSVAPEGQAGCHPPAPAPAPQPPGAPPGERQRRRTDALLNREELESLGLLGEHEPG